MTETALWARELARPEWQSLLSDSTFLVKLKEAIEEQRGSLPFPDDFLVIRNWPLEAHEELFRLLPEVATAFNLLLSFPASYEAGRGWNFGRDGSCLTIRCGHLVDGPLGFDETRQTPHGDPAPLGPYADIWMVGVD